MSKNKFYKNGQIKEEVEYIDNIKNGRVRWYYLNGELKGTGFYNDGRCDGDFITYYRSGKIKSRVSYKDGEPITLIEYFEDEPKKKIVIPEKKVERKTKIKNSSGKKILIISIILISSLIYTLSNLLNKEKKEIVKLPEIKKENKLTKNILENKVIDKKKNKQIEMVQVEKEIINLETIEKKDKKRERSDIQEKILESAKELKLDKVEEKNFQVQQVQEVETSKEKIKYEVNTLPITKLKEIQNQTKLRDERSSPVKVQEKKVVNQKKNQILQEIKTEEVNIDYVSRVTQEEREKVLRGIMNPKYNICKDDRYGYSLVYPYNIVDIFNYQTKYLRGKAFSSKGGYLLGKLIVIPSNELKKLRAYNIQQLFENELRSKYPIIEKKLNIKSGNYEIKFQMNNKYLERYVVLSKNGDYYLFLTMEYNQILEKDLKKIIKKMKNKLEAN